jgi:peroxiredoxin
MKRYGFCLLNVLLLAALTTGCGKDEAETGGQAASNTNGEAAEAGSLQAKLDARKQEFLKDAPPERAAAYDEGVEALREKGIEKNALNVGDEAPDFTLPASNRESVTLSEVLEDGPAVLVWYRGGWCPYCMIELKAYQEHLESFRDAGARVLAIAPETPEMVRRTASKGGLSYSLLSDVGNKVAEKYGLVYTLPEVVQEQFAGRLDLEKYNDDASMQLPISATYVVDTDGVIQFAATEVDYRVRAEPADVLDRVQELTAEAK